MPSLVNEISGLVEKVVVSRGETLVLVVLAVNDTVLTDHQGFSQTLEILMKI